jgi:hypothetical protein
MEASPRSVDHPLLHGRRWHLDGAHSTSMRTEIDEAELAALRTDAHLRRRVERFLASIAALVRGLTSFAMTIAGRVVVVVELEGSRIEWVWR